MSRARCPPPSRLSSQSLSAPSLDTTAVAFVQAEWARVSLDHSNCKHSHTFQKENSYEILSRATGIRNPPSLEIRYRTQRRHRTRCSSANFTEDEITPRSRGGSAQALLGTTDFTRSDRPCIMSLSATSRKWCRSISPCEIPKGIAQRRHRILPGVVRARH